MWQSPAIFLQHCISDFVIVEVGRQARAGVIVHTKTRKKDRTTRRFAMLKMLYLLTLYWQGSRFSHGCADVQLCLLRNIPISNKVVGVKECLGGFPIEQLTHPDHIVPTPQRSATRESTLIEVQGDKGIPLAAALPKSSALIGGRESTLRFGRPPGNCST